MAKIPPNLLSTAKFFTDIQYLRIFLKSLAFTQRRYVLFLTRDSSLRSFGRFVLNDKFFRLRICHSDARRNLINNSIYPLIFYGTSTVLTILLIISSLVIFSASASYVNPIRCLKTSCTIARTSSGITKPRLFKKA